MAPVVPAQRTGVTFEGRYYAVNNHSLAIEMALNGLGVVMGVKRRSSRCSTPAGWWPCRK